MESWIWAIPFFWLFLAVLLIAVESISFNLITTWFAIGAIASMIVSLIWRDAITAQIIVFFVVSIVILFTIRDIAVKKLKTGSNKTNVSALIGKEAVVTKKIERYNHGEVKVNGNYWTAQTLEGTTIYENEIIEIVEISGVKLIVKRLNP